MQFCSQPLVDSAVVCTAAKRKIYLLIEMINPKKFWARVDVKAKHECWEWQSTTQGKGARAYGYFRTGSRKGGSDSLKKHYAHRHAYHLSAPSDPIDGLDIRHRCDNPRCCNPHHLVPGTRSQNVMDAVYRNRVQPPKRYS